MLRQKEISFLYTSSRKVYIQSNHICIMLTTTATSSPRITIIICKLRKTYKYLHELLYNNMFMGNETMSSFLAKEGKKLQCFGDRELVNMKNRNYSLLCCAFIHPISIVEACIVYYRKE